MTRKKGKNKLKKKRKMKSFATKLKFAFASLEQEEEEEEEFFAEVCSTTHVTPLNTDYDASRTEMMKELHAGLDNI